MFECHWGIQLVENARYESWFCYRLQEHTGIWITARVTGEKKFLIKKLNSEILYKSANASFLMVYVYIIHMRM